MDKESATFWGDIKKFEDTLAKDPQSYCFAPLSELYRKMGLLDDAISVAKRGIEVHPEYIGGYMAIGRAFFEKGIKEEAKTALEKVVKATPENLLAQKILSQIYLEEGNTAAAERALRLLVTFNPEDTESRLSLEALARTSLGSNGEEPRHESKESRPRSEPEGFHFDEAPEAGEILDISAGEHTETQDEGIEGQEFSFDEWDETPESSSHDQAAIETSLSTITLAELYESQGHYDRALDIYREISARDPDNRDVDERIQSLQSRLAVDSGVAASLSDDTVIIQPREMPDSTDIESNLPHEELLLRPDAGRCPDESVIEELKRFLDSIERRRECRQGIR